MVIFSFTDAGSIEVSHKVTNMNVKWYTEWSDTNGDGVNDGTAQLILEVMLALMFVYAASLELAEIAGTIWDEMSVFRGLRLHFSNFWNILDAANIGLQLASVSIWIGYQATRRAELAPLLRYDVYDNPAQPAANFLMPHKRSSGVVDDALDANATGLGGALAADAEHRWQLPTDEEGLRLLGESMTTIQHLSDLLTLYFFVSGVSLLLMVARSLKMVDFQRHLDLTVRTLSRSSLDLVHFLIIFFITLGMSTMVGHLMLGPNEEALSNLDLGFNFHFELMLGSSIDILAKLFADRTIVRSDVEYFALCIYSFGVPIFLLFVLLNLILGIVGDAFGEEKENLGELSEPTLIEDFLLALSYRYGRFMGRHPSFDALIRTLKAARKSSPPKSIDVLASALGAKPRPGVGDAVAEGPFASARPRRVPSRRVRRMFPSSSGPSRSVKTPPRPLPARERDGPSFATRASSPMSFLRLWA